MRGVSVTKRRVNGPRLTRTKNWSWGGSFEGGGAIVGPARSGPCGSLLSVHAGCISDQKKGEWTPTYPRKKLALGGGHLRAEGPGRPGPCGSCLSVHVGCISDQKKGECTPTYPHKKLVLGGSDGGRRHHC